MKLKIVVLLLIAGSVFFSCKKEKNQPASTTTNTGGGGGGGGGNGFSASNATTFSGIFSVGEFTYSILSSSFTNISTSGSAYFTGTPQAYMNSATGFSVNCVRLNGDSMFYFTGSNSYGTSGTVTSASQTWSVDGANGIPSFTFSNTNLAPTANGIASVPTTISKASGFTVNLTSVANITDGFMIIDDGTSGPNSSLIYTISAGNNAIAVTSASLAALATGTNANIYLALQNNKAYSYSSKNYQFRKEKQLILTGVTINP